MPRKEQTRGGVPKASEHPVMNLVTSKNFIVPCLHVDLFLQSGTMRWDQVANAVEVILAAPKKVPEGAKERNA